MNIELLPFQNEAVRKLLEAVEKGNQNIILKSCTGSGKTIILTHFMAEYLKYYSKTVFVWFTPGKGNLEEQLARLKEEVFAYISGMINVGTQEEYLRPMFRDYDAVKAAWYELIRKNR